ncbi:hypothetical protein [Pseudohalioglobus lutimaris]|uniref:Uncharacterized protein n=1 Tax=Pseudohalioglobus lutimaris TaxID=1737061 RepID=A0A2N5WYC2_9GAMM|nr:hypothetical protein [Pseudohalioglobus lutimaris]PLW67227.1 hypothetical protein C0039_18015 [Pseudohalioglobus lutimaris]
MSRKRLALCQLLAIGLFSVFSYFVESVAASLGVGVAVISTVAVFVLAAPALIGAVASVR